MNPGPDRLGDAVREIARGLVSGDLRRCQFEVNADGMTVVFELRAVSARAHTRTTRIGGELVEFRK